MRTPSPRRSTCCGQSRCGELRRTERLAVEDVRNSGGITSMFRKPASRLLDQEPDAGLLRFGPYRTFLGDSPQRYNLIFSASSLTLNPQYAISQANRVRRPNNARRLI